MKKIFLSINILLSGWKKDKIFNCSLNFWNSFHKKLSSTEIKKIKKGMLKEKKDEKKKGFKDKKDDFRLFEKKDNPLKKGWCGNTELYNEKPCHCCKVANY